MCKGKKSKKKFSQSFLNALQEGIWELVLFVIAFVVGGGTLLLLGGTDLVTRMGLEATVLIGLAALVALGGIVFLIIYLVNRWKK